MSKAFLSHSSAQKKLVETIANKLGRENCVLDKFNFEVGSPTLDSIMAGIGNTDLFVLFLSDEALNSTWVQKELSIINNLINHEFKKKVQVFLIDSTITHLDERIPKWLTDAYNIKLITDPILLYKKIDSKLRDISIENYPYIKQRESIFVGRNQLMQEFEEKYYNLNNVKPSAIIVSGFEEVGRRKFIKHALGKIDRITEYHNPITIALDSRESVEDFILKIEDLNSKNTEDVLRKVTQLSLEQKTDYAKELLIKFQQINEILFILDNGSIIRPHAFIARWFDEVISDEIFKNSTCVCLISKFRPHMTDIRTSTKYISFHVPELEPNDRQVLFLKYCELFKIAPKKEETEKILRALNGMPTQIFYCSRMIEDDGITKVINKLDEIKKFGDIKVFQIIDAIKVENNKFYELLTFIAKFEFISYDFIYKVFGRTPIIEDGLDKLYIYGVYDRIGVNKEYIQTHHAISDYIKRSKLKLTQQIKDNLARELRELNLNGDDQNDISQLLITIKSLLESKVSLPDKYLIPSFIIRGIQNHYYAEDYLQVEILSKRILDNYRNYDTDILREVRYILISTYCRRAKDEFHDLIQFFSGADYYFLRGFYLRNKKDFPEAERILRMGLEKEKSSQKIRRELVSVLLMQDKYSDALGFAEANYKQNNLNAFHIQGYFKSLVRKPSLTLEDRRILDELMENINKSHDYKASEILLTMQGEFEYYVNKNLLEAIRMLKEAESKSYYKLYPRRALLEIYQKNEFNGEASRLRTLISGHNRGKEIEIN